MSTPLSCSQKKSSAYKSSKSSSSLTTGTNIGSGIKLNANKTPLTICTTIARKTKKPEIEQRKWYLTDKIWKYCVKFLRVKVK